MWLRDAEHGAIFPANPPGATWVYSRSNGVAAAADWRQACRAAREELEERDRVLRAWFGETQPDEIALPTSDLAQSLAIDYDLRAYRFPGPPIQGGGGSVVVGIFAFPRLARAPLMYGFGAGVTMTRALGRAWRECVQRLGFLWGEAIPTQEPEFEATPSYHQELYLWPPAHGRLRAWLEPREKSSRPGIQRMENIVPSGYVDLTPEHLSNHGIRIAKALAADEWPLTFGMGHPNVCDDIWHHSVHPIT